MINKNRKSQKGITLVTLSIAITIMLIIVTVLVYNINTGTRVKALNNMYQDITKLKDKIDLYYANYHTIPIVETKYENITGIQPINPNDNDTYYVIDLEALENLKLTYGKGYATYKAMALQSLTDLYIMNERSHSIYYVKGIEIDNNRYYTIPEDNTKVELNDIVKLEVIKRDRNTVSLKMYAVDKTNGIKKMTLMQNDKEYKTYEYDPNDREAKIEVIQVALEEVNNIFYLKVEDENGNSKNSEQITQEKEMVEWVLDSEGNEI